MVKPSGGTGGGRDHDRHHSALHVAHAAAAASVYHDELLIEEHVAGDNYRLLFLDGALLDAFVRRPPFVVGDGRSTVAKLVANANAETACGCRDLSGLDHVRPRHESERRQAKASRRSVPASGRVVTLKQVVNENRGVDNTTATHRLCPELVAASARAALALHVRFAGVDVITPDPGLPLESAGGVVIEVNATPNFYFHYHKSDGCFPVAVRL